MIFTTQCPSCEATFPIDSAKVPDDGVYARCSQCEGVFLVEVPADEGPASGAIEATILPAVAVESSPPEASVVEPAPAEPATELEATPSFDQDNFAAALAEPPAEPVWEPSPESVEAEASSVVTETAAPAAPAPAFGKRDPKERAQRLARVLVSDMIAYHPDKHRKSLEEGTLKPDFEEEIDKSWNEYVDQVGREVANSTGFFTDALNEILAKGTVVF